MNPFSFRNIIPVLLLAMSLFVTLGCENPSLPPGDTNETTTTDNIVGTWEGAYDPQIWKFTFIEGGAATLYTTQIDVDDCEMSGTYHLDSELKLLVVTLTDTSTGTPPFAFPTALAFSYDLSSGEDILTLYVINFGGVIILNKVL